jgi:hypothetical protein
MHSRDNDKHQRLASQELFGSEDFVPSQPDDVMFYDRDRRLTSYNSLVEKYRKGERK